MNTDDKLTEKLKTLLTQLTDQEVAIQLLRANNFSKSESIEILREVFNLPYYEAQTLVHHSQTWSDVKEADTKIINDFFDALEEL